MSTRKRKISGILLILTLVLTGVIATITPQSLGLSVTKTWASLPQNYFKSTSDKPEAEFALKDGDRVVFFGDSITESRLYTNYIEHYVASHYPERKISFFNTGWSCDRVTGTNCKDNGSGGGLARIERDVIAYRPTVVTLLFGMNDGQYQDFDPALLQVYENGITSIIQQLKIKNKTQIYVMTPTVYDGTRNPSWSKTNRYNDVLYRYSEAAKQIALREQLPVIDLHSVTTDALRQAKEADPTYTFVPDGVHPDKNGHLIMATEILRVWGAPTKGEEIVKKVELGNNKTVNLSVNAPIIWPFPLPSEKIRDIRKEIIEMGQVNLRITGLPSGKYAINIDRADAGEYTAEQLNSGIPLSSLSTQATELSRSLAALIDRRTDIFYIRWRKIDLPLSKDYKSAAVAVSALDSLDNEMAQRVRILGKLHEYNVVINLIDRGTIERGEVQ